MKEFHIFAVQKALTRVNRNVYEKKHNTCRRVAAGMCKRAGAGGVDGVVPIELLIDYLTPMARKVTDMGQN